MKNRWISAILALTLLLGLACGCAAAAEDPEGDEVFLGFIPDNEIPLADLPAACFVLAPTATGTAVEQNSSAVIDYSNAKDGYVMVKWTGGSTSSKLKVIVKGSGTGEQYKYDLRSDGGYDTYPLSDGNGKYTIQVCKQASDTQYALVLAASINVQLTDEFAPFIRPNQYVNYTENSEVVSMAQKLVSENGAVTNLDKVGVIYEWVVTNLTYDNAKASSAASGSLTGYLPDVDSVMKEKKGICFDYAALMAAMLRSQGVPIKLVVGYTSQGQYHAWINVWSEEDGWVENIIYFNGKVWMLMDPTFASSGKQSQKIMDYISNSANYTAKYLY